ncbi:MAG: hypothetical protein WAP47_20155 [Candidatus Rokuibacteriota bacterium]
MSWPPEYDDRYLPAPGSRYWFPERECQDPEARDGEIVRKIQATMAWAWERAPFYRKKWQGAGLEPGDVKGLDDFRKVPVVTKQELREDQAAHPPLGSYLCIPREEVRRIHGTSGTTGKPTAFAIGRDDWRRIANAHARIMWGFGLRPSDTVFFGSFFSLYLGGWGGAGRRRAPGRHGLPLRRRRPRPDADGPPLAQGNAPVGLLRDAVLRPLRRGKGAAGRNRSQGVRPPDPLLLGRAGGRHPVHEAPRRGGVRRGLRGHRLHG